MLERLEVLDVTLPNSDSGAVEDLAGAIQSARAARPDNPQSRGDVPQPAAPHALLDALADAVTTCPELVRPLPLPFIIIK
jgi:hypothetical protein